MNSRWYYLLSNTQFFSAKYSHYAGDGTNSPANGVAVPVKNFNSHVFCFYSGVSKHVKANAANNSVLLMLIVVQIYILCYQVGV